MPASTRVGLVSWAWVLVFVQQVLYRQAPPQLLVHFKVKTESPHTLPFRVVLRVLREFLPTYFLSLCW